MADRLVDPQVASFPLLFAGVAVETSDALRAETDKHMVAFDDGCRSRGAVQMWRVMAIGLIDFSFDHIEDFDVLCDLAGFEIDADRAK